MKTLTNNALCVLLIGISITLFVAGPGIVSGEEIKEEYFDSNSPIGSGAKKKLIELFRLYEGIMTNNMRELVSRVKEDSDPKWWTETVSDAIDKRLAWRGTALEMYRAWAEGNGADPTEIEDFPTDWVVHEEGYHTFFKCAAKEGQFAFAALVALVRDATYMNGYVWTDGLRIDDVVLIATEADDAMLDSLDPLAQFLAGKKNGPADRRNLERLRDRLVRHTNAWRNRTSMLDDMTNRVQAMTTGDMEASKRIAEVEKLFLAFQKAVEDSGTAGLREEAEAAHYRSLIESKLEFFQKSQADWLKRVAPVTENTLFTSLESLKGPYDKFAGPIYKRIAMINQALK